MALFLCIIWEIVVESGVRMFGTYVRKLDAKKRIAIPPKLKSGLGTVVFVTIGIDQVIEIRSKSTFDALRTKFNSTYNEFGKDYREFKRLFFGSTEELKLDKLNRVLLPASLLAQAAIKNDIVIIGMDDKIEIWPKTKYDSVYNQNAKQDMLEKLAEKLYKAGESF